MADPRTQAYRQVIRITKADSAWVYHVLEAQEGIVSYSTLPDPKTGALLSPLGLPACDLALSIPAAFKEEMQVVVEHLRAGGVWIEEISPPEWE